jgi:cell division protein FtsA
MMLDRILPNKVYCGLDIGTQSLKAALIKGAPQTGQWEILGIFEQPTCGYRDGSVTDLADFSECVAHTLNQISHKAGVKIRDVSVGIGASFMDVRPTHTVIPLVEKGSAIITQKDIRKIDRQSRLLGTEMDEDLIHGLPLSYQVDEVNSVLNPLGLHGRKLGAHSLMMVSPTNRVRNIMKAIHQAGYEVHNLCFGNYLAHLLSLTPEERANGVLLIDFGASATTVLLFKDGAPRFYERIPLGGQHITKSVAGALQVSFELAEEIKRSYGDLSSADFSNHEEILVKKESAYLPVRREIIYHAVYETAQQVFSGIKDSLSRGGLRDQINRGAVLIGGGSALNGIIEIFEREVSIPARIGRLTAGAPKLVQQGARFLTVLSVAQAAFHNAFPGSRPEEEGTWFRRAVNRVRGLYQEYF